MTLRYVGATDLLTGGDRGKSSCRNFQFFI